MPIQESGQEQTIFRKYRICPHFERGVVDSILVGPDSDLSIVGYLTFHFGKALQIRRVTSEELSTKLQALSDTPNPLGANGSVIQPSNAIPEVDSSIIRLIDDIIGQAINTGASDIHFEPFERNMICRYRINGILRHDRDLAKESVPEILARIKIMAGLDISEKRRPQDGRIRFKLESKTVDIRVSILPTDFGEKAVLRILDKATLRLDLDLLGLTDDQRALLEHKIQLANGIILVTGPTGSGKTTTLYAVLNRLRSPGVNITTIEDPIEYNLEDINQTQIKPEIGLTFAAALRAILRQDPNIIMVGEIRDRDTLDQALRGALTGHLVLSTLHTNDAISTITRMLDLGAESFLLGSTVKLIIAQRLIQMICPACKTKDHDPQTLVAARKLGLDTNMTFYAGNGCDKCGGTGYSGRTAIYEMLDIKTSYARMIAENRLEVDIRTAVVRDGFQELRQAGIQKITEGISTPLEVFRAVAG